MTDGFEDRPPDDRTDGVGGENGDGGTDPNDDGAGPDGDGEEHDPSLAGVFGARPEDEPPRKELVPESPSLESALFLLLGVLLGGFVVYRAVTVFTA